MASTSQGGRGPCQRPRALLQSGAVTEHARAVIIGGGVGGASIAYHLTAKGWRDIVLVERAELTSGSTFHSAGPRRAAPLLRRADAPDDVERRVLPAARRRDGARPGLEGDGQPPARVLARSRPRAPAPDRLGEDVRAPARGGRTGRGAAALPGDGLDGVLGAVYLPTDGHLDPSSLAMALAEGARQRGADDPHRHRVLRIGVRDGRVREVETTGGPSAPTSW